MGSESETHTRGLPSVPFGFCGFGLGLYMRFCMFVVLGFARLIKSDEKKKKNSECKIGELLVGFVSF